MFGDDSQLAESFGPNARALYSPHERPTMSGSIQVISKMIVWVNQCIYYSCLFVCLKTEGGDVNEIDKSSTTRGRKQKNERDTSLNSTIKKLTGGKQAGRPASLLRSHAFLHK